MPTVPRSLPQAPDAPFCAVEGKAWNQLAEEVRRANDITFVAPLFCKELGSGRSVSIQLGNAGGSPMNLAGTLAGGGIYTANPITVNQTGTLNVANNIGTSSLGTVNTSKTFVLINTDEIGINFNGTATSTHFAPCGGSFWNVVTGTQTSMTATVSGTAYPVQLFNWSVKGRIFPCVLSYTGGNNGGTSGTVATYNTNTYAAVINGQTAVTGMVPSFGPLLPGIITNATNGFIAVDLNGSITIDIAWEPQPGIIGCG